MTLRRVLALAALLLASCDQAPKPVASFARSGELVVLTVNGPSTYYEDAEGLPTGFEYDLATLFARELNLRPVFQLVDNPADIDPMLRAGRGHLAAAALARHFDFPGGLTWGPSYFTTQHQIVGRLGDPRPKSLGDIAGQRVGVVEESVGEYMLAEDPKVSSIPLVRMPPGTSTHELLEEVAQGRLDYALVESTRFTLARRFYPQIDVAFNVGKPVEYAWLVGKLDKRPIMDAAKPFFERIRKDGTLKRLVDRYYGHALRMNSIDSGTLLDKIPAVLPRLKPFFVEAENASGVDWRLIAAIGYQESHWDPDATSPTGVRGLMMLTDDTADRLQIKNRLDARESILGGARYFALVRESLAPRIEEPDRTYLALAAYNLGLGHLEDARILAQRNKLNPDKWQDVRQVLNQLAEPEVFTTLKQGYARGFEALQFVDNVRNYYDVISNRQPRDAPLMPTLPPDQPLDNARVSGQFSSKALPPGK
ncbi:MAG TPA: membrane-bound lytic murein transglycosylase MltF [Usitatibacter sp.]|jgi:membrane-bound lytic murein transglycosylase F|nr:membrane-bound lytic murein transglycosylase MltF [Usitatibacter sp.]